MARIIGNNANLSVNAVQVEGDLNEIEIGFTAPEAEITSFTDVYGNYLAGKKSARTRLGGIYNPSAAASDVTIFPLVGGVVVSMVFDPTGSGPAANSPTYNCAASGLAGVLVTSYEIDIPVNGAGTIRAELEHSGSTTRATA